MARVLPLAEYERLSVTGMPPFVPAVRPEDTEVIVVEEDGRIVASVGVLRIPHYEGWWIAPDYRGNAGVIRRLLKGAMQAALPWSSGWVWAAADTDHVRDLMRRLGGVELPVTSYALRLGIEGS